MTGNELGDYIKARFEDALDKGGFPEAPSGPQPNQWWCPHCGHTQNAPVADRPDPEPPCPTCRGTRITHDKYGVVDCPDCDSPALVGDETPAPTTALVCAVCGAIPSVMVTGAWFCPSHSPVGVPVGDAPAPAACTCDDIETVRGFELCPVHDDIPGSTR